MEKKTTSCLPTISHLLPNSGFFFFFFITAQLAFDLTKKKNTLDFSATTALSPSLRSAARCAVGERRREWKSPRVKVRRGSHPREKGFEELSAA